MKWGFLSRALFFLTIFVFLFSFINIKTAKGLTIVNFGGIVTNSSGYSMSWANSSYYFLGFSRYWKGTLLEELTGENGFNYSINSANVTCGYKVIDSNGNTVVDRNYSLAIWYFIVGNNFYINGMQGVDSYVRDGCTYIISVPSFNNGSVMWYPFTIQFTATEKTFVGNMSYFSVYRFRISNASCNLYYANQFLTQELSLPGSSNIQNQKIIIKISELNTGLIKTDITACVQFGIVDTSKNHINWLVKGRDYTFTADPNFTNIYGENSEAPVVYWSQWYDEINFTFNYNNKQYSVVWNPRLSYVGYFDINTGSNIGGGNKGPLDYITDFIQYLINQMQALYNKIIDLVNILETYLKQIYAFLVHFFDKLKQYLIDALKYAFIPSSSDITNQINSSWVAPQQFFLPNMNNSSYVYTFNLNVFGGDMEFTIDLTKSFIYSQKDIIQTITHLITWLIFAYIMLEFVM